MVGNIGGFGDRFPVNNQPKVSHNNIQETVTVKSDSEVPVLSSPVATNPVGDQVIISTSNLKTDKNENKKVSAEVEDAWGETGASLVDEPEQTLLAKTDVNPPNVKVNGDSVFTPIEMDKKTALLISQALMQSSSAQQAIPILNNLPAPVSPEIS